MVSFCFHIGLNPDCLLAQNTFALSKRRSWFDAPQEVLLGGQAHHERIFLQISPNGQSGLNAPDEMVLRSYSGLPGVLSQLRQASGTLSWDMVNRLAVPLLFLMLLLPAACATRVGADGQKQSRFDPRYLAKTEIDRVIDTDRAEVMAGMRRIAEKLYRRNPREWRRSGQPSLEAALDRLFSGSVDFPELEGRREGAAALFAFGPNYQGDRVLGVMAGLLGMVYAAFENKKDFYVLDELNEQKLHNCARNVEIAVWKLSSTKNAAGELLLLSNELDANYPNLSFEREFGRVIGLLDFLSKVVADKQGRSITRFTQSIATAVFLPVGALGLK